jgi:hypothetical protein
LANRVGKTLQQVGEDLDAWRLNVPNLRKVFGEAAKKNGWFKTLELGQELGRIVADDLPAIEESDLATTLAKIRAFAEHG